MSNNVSSVLIGWYKKNARNLPWRQTRDPYRIWLSEVILQQTRVEQGRPYYQKFVNRFPSVFDLARADEEAVLKLWQGLGYYSRARNLLKTARQVVADFDGRFPSDFTALKKLPGIGDYTAAAISSFAFELPHPVVDGNVQRFLSRYLGMGLPINSAKGKKKITLAAQLIFNDKFPALHNQAIMEFGALQCKPVNPSCNLCPLLAGCVAFQKKSVHRLPLKIKNSPPVDRFLHYLVINSPGGILVRKRTGNDIWKNLYDFPAIESGRQLSPRQLMKTQAWKKLFGSCRVHLVSVSSTYDHKLSHQALHCIFLIIKAGNHLPASGQFRKVPLKNLHSLAVPRLIERFLSENDFTLLTPRS